MGGQQIAAAGKIIEVRLNALQFPAAAANAVILLGITFLIITMQPVSFDTARSFRMGERRSLGFLLLAAFFALYVLFLYGPMIAIFVLSFQGPQGGLNLFR